MASDGWDFTTSTTFLLWHVMQRWEGDVRTALGTTGVTPAQFVLLAVVAALSDGRPPPSPAQVAAYSGMDRAGCQAMLRELERTELLWRDLGAADRTQRGYQLTARGGRALGAASRRAAEVDREMFGHVTGVHEALRAVVRGGSSGR